MSTARSEVIRTNTVSRLHPALSSANLPNSTRALAYRTSGRAVRSEPFCLLCCDGERHVTRIRDDPRRGGGRPARGHTRGRRRHLLGHTLAELLSSPQRHDAVAG